MVWLGGTAGTGSRYLISAVTPAAWGLPVATVVINVVGAFLLGVLLAALARRERGVGGRPTVRLLLGTGFLGGFTTYSALAVDTVVLSSSQLVGHAGAYAVITVLVGGLASWTGVAVGRGTARGR